jgi:predicted RNase H-like nuclease (RuvC/YqgF family)
LTHSSKSLQNLFTEKMGELEAHDKAKPAEVEEPVKDLQKQKEMEAIRSQIDSQRVLLSNFTDQMNQEELQNRSAQLRRVIADRVLGRLRNFKLQYDNFVAEAESDCAELGLSAGDLVQIKIDTDYNWFY